MPTELWAGLISGAAEALVVVADRQPDVDAAELAGIAAEAGHLVHMCRVT